MHIADTNVHIIETIKNKRDEPVKIIPVIAVCPNGQNKQKRDIE